MYQQDDQQDPFDPQRSPVQHQLYTRMQPQQPAQSPAPAPSPSPSPAPSPFNYERARDSWMSGQYGKDEAGASRWAQEHGIQYSGGDVINLPNGGGMIDILGNFKSGQNVANNWTPAGGNGLGGPTGAGPVAGPGGGGAAGGGGGFQDQIRQLLLQQLQGLSKPVSADDPTIANEMGVQSRLIERNRQDRRAAMAERAAQQGLLQGGASSGAFDADVASGYEDAGQQKSAVLSGLMGRELQARRGQLAQLLSLATQSGDAESARALQLQISQMDNELRRYGISEQGRQFNDTLGRQLGRDAEDDFRYRFGAGFGGF